MRFFQLPLIFGFFLQSHFNAMDSKRANVTFGTVDAYNQYCEKVINQWESDLQSSPSYLNVNELNVHPHANTLVPAEVEDFDKFKQSKEYPEFREKATQAMLDGRVIKEFFLSFSPLDGRPIDLSDEKQHLSYKHELFNHNGALSALPISLTIRQILQYRVQIEKLAEKLGKNPTDCVKKAKLIFHINERNKNSFIEDLKDFDWFGFSPANIVLLVQPSSGVYKLKEGHFILNSAIQRRRGHGYAFMQVFHPTLGENLSFSEKTGEVLSLSSSALAYMRKRGAEWLLTAQVCDLSQLTSATLEEDSFALALSLAEKNYSVILEMVENPEKIAGAYWVRNGTNPPFVVHTIELLHAKPGLQRPLDRLIDQKALYNRFAYYIHLPACENLLAEASLPLYVLPEETSSSYRLQSYSDDIVRLPGIHTAAFHKKGTRARPCKSDNDLKELVRFMASQDADPQFKSLAKKSFLARAKKHLQGPLYFQPAWVRALWGGSHIASLKNISDNLHEKIGETWEISAQSRNTSRWVLQNQPQPLSLEELLQDNEIAEKILGTRVFRICKNWFPILYKFLDAEQILSIHVHPNTKIAQELGEGEPGKSETWVVIDAKPDAVVYMGLQPWVTSEMLEHSVQGDLLPLMKKYPVKPGDVLRNFPGVIHSIGPGVFLAEIQGNSDVTYRFSDHNRKPSRPLHLPQALRSIDIEFSKTFDGRPKGRIEQYSPYGSKVELLVSDPYYEVRRADLNCYDHLSIDGQGDFQIVSLLSGRAFLSTGDSRIQLSQGQTVLIPASVHSIVLATEGRKTQALIIKPGENPCPIAKQKETVQFSNAKPTDKIHLAVSVGGTKIILGAMSSDGFVEIGPRIEWKKKLEETGQYTADGFVNFLVGELEAMVSSLQKKGVDLKQIRQIGLAWPGPGDYEQGLLFATFIPGFTPYPLKKALKERLESSLGIPIDIKIFLDAWADAYGEMAQNESLKNWMYLNVATGIAVGIVKDGKILDSYQWPDGRKVESGLGQIGRHLIRLNDGSWEYRPTLNGQIPPMAEGEIRLTDWLGGPGLAKRWVQHIIKKAESTNITPSCFFEYPIQELQKEVQEQNSNAIRSVLSAVQQRAVEKNELALEMITEMGKDMGLALRTFADAFPLEFFYNRIIVGGGVVENLGVDIPEEKSNLDILLAAFTRFSQISKIHRTQLDVRRELLAFKPPFTFSNAEVLVFDLDGTLYCSPELARIYRESIYQLYALSKEISLEEATQILEEKRKELTTTGMAAGDRNVIEALGFSYADMISMQSRIIRDPCSYIEPIEGLPELLKELKNRYRLVLATNNTQKATVSILKKLKIDDVFEKIYPQDVTNLHKPDSRLFQLIQTEMQAPLERMVSIGDREAADILPAKALGMQTLLVRGPEDLMKKIRELLHTQN